MGITLDNAQLKAVRNIRNGSIVCGSVGSGKSRVGLAYYFIQNKGQLDPYEPMSDDGYLQDLYIITTAKKRDSLEWEGELVHFLLSPKDNLYSNKIVIDSWNNIGKYKDVKNAFFIFDEDRVTGYGAWTKSFLQIAKNNKWIILSATPGDNYSDYAPVFIANGYFKNITEFRREHCVYNMRPGYPKLERYLNTGRLNRLRNNVLVDIDYRNNTELHHLDIYTEYDMLAYKQTMKNRWNYLKNEPVETANELCYELRRICNSDESRIQAVMDIYKDKQRVIIFYNFDYELDILKSVEYVTNDGIKAEVAEWNGHKHQPIPESSHWIYLVQYNACEGWNCILTDTMIFYSQNYSYKTMVQAAGRIDRRNTLYSDLYYYHLKSRSNIDLAISKALRNKKKFNEQRFVNM